MSPKEAIARVLTARSAFYDASKALGSAAGPAYDPAVTAEEEAFAELAASKRALRENVYTTYGVDLITLSALMQG